MKLLPVWWNITNYSLIYGTVYGIKQIFNVRQNMWDILRGGKYIV